jgi:hypothetical protein
MRLINQKVCQVQVATLNSRSSPKRQRAALSQAGISNRNESTLPGQARMSETYALQWLEWLITDQARAITSASLRKTLGATLCGVNVEATILHYVEWLVLLRLRWNGAE